MSLPLFIKAVKAPKKLPANTPTATHSKPTKPKPKPAAEPAQDVAPNTQKFAGLMSILAEHNVDSEFGPDSVDVGHTVAFRAGSFVGSGKVRGVGKDGCVVADDEAREHRVHWHEVTGHVGDPEKKEKPKKKAK